MPSIHLILSCPLLLPSIFPSIRDLSNESAVCIRWAKYWNPNFSISPSNEYSGLISLKIDLFDLLVVQGTLRSLLPRHSLKASVLWHSVFFTVQLSKPYMTTGKAIRSDQISRLVMSDSLRPHESQHARPPCPSSTPRVHWDSRPSSQWCHPAISSSVVPFSCPQSLPASESFPMSQLFAWGGQSTGVSALASFLPKKSQGWSPSEWTDWISLQSKGL